MALSDDITTRLGTQTLVEITNFDDPTATTVNTSRLDAAIEDAQGAIRRGAGLSAPSDTTSDEYDTYRELVVLGVEYYLQKYRSRSSSETESAKREFREAMGDTRTRTDVPFLTNSVVDMSEDDQDSRKARFHSGHFDGFRIN